MNKKNLSKEEVQDIATYFNEEPLFNKVIITLNTEVADGNLVLSDNSMDDIQYVVAKGSSVHNLEVGQKVRVDLEKLMVSRQVRDNSHESSPRLQIDPIEFEGVTYMIIEDRFIKTKFKN